MSGMCVSSVMCPGLLWCFWLPCGLLCCALVIDIICWESTCGDGWNGQTEGD